MTLFSTSGPSKKLSEVIAPFETKRDYTECLKHFLLSVSHERRPTESLLTLAGGVNYGSSQLPCSPLPGRADTCKLTGDPRSQRGLWASTQSKMQKEVFFILLVPFHLNISALSGWCLHSCPTTITRIFFFKYFLYALLLNLTSKVAFMVCIPWMTNHDSATVLRAPSWAWNRPLSKHLGGFFFRSQRQLGPDAILLNPPSLQ